MFEKLFLFFRGYVILKIQEIGRERFLNLCKIHEVEIFDIVAINQETYCKIKIQDYFKIRPIVRKTGCLPQIIEKRGMVFHIKHCLKRKGILIGGVLFYFMIIQLTGRIWHIDVT